MAEKPKKIDSWKTPAISRDTPRTPSPSRDMRNTPHQTDIANKIQPSIDSILIISGLEGLCFTSASTANEDASALCPHRGQAPSRQDFATVPFIHF